MSLRIPEGFAEMWFRFNLAADPEPMFVALGFGVAQNPGPTDVARLEDIFFDAFTARVAASFTSGPGHVILGDDSGDLRIDSVADPQTFTGSQPSLTSNTAMLVRKVTNVGGRRNRGRMFIPGIGETNVDPTGLLTVGEVGAWQTALNTFYGNFTADVVVTEPVLLHSSAPFDPTSIVNLVAQNRVATQRRRMRP